MTIGKDRKKIIKDIKKTAPIGAVFINCMSRKCAAKAF